MNTPMTFNNSMRGIGILSMLAFGAALPLASLHAGSFNPELLVSSGGGLASGPTLAADPANNIFLIWVEDGDLQVVAGIDLSAGGIPITSGGLQHIDPHVYVSPTATATVIFEREGSPPGTQPDIFFLQSPFGTPAAISLDSAPEHQPRIDGIPAGSRHAAWVRDDGGSNTVLISFDLSGSQEVAVGNAPAVAASGSGEVFVVYERDGDIYLSSGDAGGLAEVTLSADPDLETDPRIVVDDSGIPHVAFARGGDVIYIRGNGSGGFLAPVTVPDGGGDAENPEIRVSPGGIAHLVFEEGGDLWRTSGSVTVFLPADNITLTPGTTETGATFDVDNLGYFHVAYERDDEVYYQNEVPPPVASFTVDPNTGEQPLVVQFTDTSLGVIANHQWDFGDGFTSNEQNPTHTYETTGNYGVSLSLEGPGGVNTLFRPNLIQVVSPSYVMRVPDVIVFQGLSDVYVPVLGTHPTPAQGYQISLAWETGVLDLVDATVDISDVEDLNPEFVATNIVDTGPVGTFTLGVIFDISPPFDGRTLDPGTDQRLINLIFDIGISAPTGVTIIDMEHGLGVPPVVNLFTIDAFSVIPVIEDGVVTVLPFVFPPPTVFIRGDVDSTSTVNIADCIYVLTYLFQGGPAPNCIDAADVDDGGGVDIADAITLLNFVFNGGQVLPIPYPTPGLDPTPDPLGDC